MKVRPKGPGESSHQYGIKPAKKMFQSSNQVGMNALKNASFKGKKFVASEDGANKKTDQKTTKAAFKLFSKINES
jgi:hypothetical protein